MAVTPAVLLVLLASAWPGIRTYFPNILPNLINILSNGQGATAAGVAMLLGEMGLLGFLGAAIHLIPGAIRRPLITALLVTGAIALFSDVPLNIANELLERLSGGTMTVRFVTQAAYKDKSRDDLRETLDIQISDGVGMRDYEMFSGGEAFRVNFAIRLALSEVLAQRAGARLQTLVIDEGFGSQDALGRQRTNCSRQRSGRAWRRGQVAETRGLYAVALAQGHG